VLVLRERCSEDEASMVAQRVSGRFEAESPNGFDGPPFPVPIESSRSVAVSSLGSGLRRFGVDSELVGTGGGGGSDGLELCDGGRPGGRAAGGGLVDTAAPRLRVLLPLHRPTILLQVDQPPQVQPLLVRSGTQINPSCTLDVFLITN